MNEPAIEWLGERALLLRFGDAIERSLNERVHDAALALRAAGIAGIVEIVPAYSSLCVHCDPTSLTGSTESARELLVARVRDAIVGGRAATAKTVREDKRQQNDTAATVEIPVCYGGAFGPDLDAVAVHAALDAADVIAMHAAAKYQVAMLGFAPGFPYLLGLDTRLHTPRLAQPRTRVPPGSVAIGGAQTGIYPRELPGGWRIIGRTPTVLFDATRAPPALIAPGQRVRFRAIDADEFAELSR